MTRQNFHNNKIHQFFPSISLDFILTAINSVSFGILHARRKLFCSISKYKRNSIHFIIVYNFSLSTNLLGVVAAICYSSWAMQLILKKPKLSSRTKYLPVHLSFDATHSFTCTRKVEWHCNCVHTKLSGASTVGVFIQRQLPIYHIRYLSSILLLQFWSSSPPHSSPPPPVDFLS